MLSPSAAFAAAPAPAVPTAAALAPAPSERTVQSILIEGTVNVRPADISARIRTRIGTVATREGLREDVKAIWAMGSFEDVSVDVAELPEGVRVTYRVVERPKVREVRYVGARALSEKELKDLAVIKEGEFYDAVRVRQLTEKLLALYREKGYPDATVRTELAPAEKERGQRDLVITVNEGAKRHVEKVRFTGLESFPEGALRKILKNKEAAFIFQSGLFLKDELEADRRRIQDFYKNEGFLKVRVAEPVVEPGQKPDAVVLTFAVEEGRRYDFRSVRFEGPTLFTERELQAKLDLEPGQRLSQRKVDEGVAAMREMYSTRGYIYANVVPEYVFDEAEGQVELVLRVQEGPRAVIDRILVRGNEETREKIILRELEPGLEEGKTFDTALVRRSQENIYNLGFFEDVRVYTEPSFKTGHEHLIFEVKERQTGTVSLGGGYSSQFGFVGFLQLTKANLFGLGIRVSAEWEIGQRRKNLQLNYFDPWFLDSKISMGLGFWDTDRDLPNTFRQRSTGGSVEWGYRFPDKRWRVSVGYKYQVDDVDPSFDRNGDGVRDVRDLPSGTVDTPQATSSPSLTVLYDRRDNIFDPFEGQRHRVFLQVAGGPIPSAGLRFLGGDTKFYKVIYDGSLYEPVPVKLLPYVGRPSAAFNLRFGRGWGFDGQDVPIFERFFLGGTDSVRGYNERDLGPRDPATGSPAGGRVMFQLNTELKWPLVRRVLTLALPFYDVGYTWTDFPLERGAVEDRLGSLATSVGFGVRLTIPGTILVIRIDYGWGQTLGYNPPPSGKLHFNIGNIF